MRYPLKSLSSRLLQVKSILVCCTKYIVPHGWEVMAPLKPVCVGTVSAPRSSYPWLGGHGSIEATLPPPVPQHTFAYPWLRGHGSIEAAVRRRSRRRERRKTAVAQARQDLLEDAARPFAAQSGASQPACGYSLVLLADYRHGQRVPTD